MSHYLIAGCGYVGMRLATLLLEDGHRVTGVRRSWPGASADIPQGLDQVTADLTDPELASRLLPRQFTHVVYAASAGEFTDAAYERAYVAGLRQVIAFAQRHVPGLQRFLFTSSTGVYTQTAGELVDEKSAVADASAAFSARRVLQGEALLRAAALPAVVVRFGGIYGPGRESLLDGVLGGIARAGGPPQWTNRIHRDDCAGVVRFLATLDQPDFIYIAVDDEPAPQGEIVAWLAAELGLALPPEGEATRARQGGNRRCANVRLKAAGYQFAYPSYREGFRARITRERASPDRPR